MSKRFAHIRELVHLREIVAKYPEQTDRLIKESILYTLPPAYLKCYEWIRQGTFTGTVTTAMVVKAWDWQPNMASTVLNELWQFGLLERTENRDDSGRWYVYKVKE